MRLAAQLRQLALQEEGRTDWRETMGAAIDRETRQRTVTEPAAADSPDSLWTEVSTPSLDYIGGNPDQPDSVDCPAPNPSTRAAQALVFDKLHALKRGKRARDAAFRRYRGGPLTLPSPRGERGYISEPSHQAPHPRG